MSIKRSAVLFPTCGPEGRMNSVCVTAYPDRHTGMRSCPSSRKVALVKDLLGHGRHDEGIETVDIDVVVQFDDDDFQGQSFGLALALADKLARFSDETGSSRICGTGIIANKGRIEAVEHFPAKVAQAQLSLTQGDIFVFPKSNEEDDQGGLRRIAAQGVQLIGVQSLEELQHLWDTNAGESSQSSETSVKRVTDWIWIVFGLIVGFSSILGASFLWIYAQ